MLRRDVLMGLMALASAPMAARANEPGLRAQDTPAPFSRDDLVRRAQEMAAQVYEPRATIPQAWQDLSYDQYRKIWFDTRNALWTDTDTPVQVDAFPPGLYFPRPVEINVVENGRSAPLAFDMGVFDTTDKFPDVPIDDSLGYSGLRLRAAQDQPGIFTEFFVMQGASYFRGIGAGQIYGLSARGLAIDTAEPSGEEFPEFISIWVERPAPGQEDVVLHALMDSPSVTGCYRFRITPGLPLVMDVTADLFAREQLDHIGIAPLTSMFLFDETNRDMFSDFRPAVHDSDGLLVQNGAGETLWRPLANPKSLQISSFVDQNPKGFGLIQRARRFGDFADLEALYHRRPSLWVTPGEGWGQGAVTLVEIPADLEIYDNVVAYWRPRTPLAAGQSHRMNYRLAWGEEPSMADRPARVLNTRMGARPEGGMVVAIDFERWPDMAEDLAGITQLIRSNHGTVSDGVLQLNPETGGPRLAFTFDPGEAPLVEFRVQLRGETGPLSEVWLYRWTA